MNTQNIVELNTQDGKKFYKKLSARMEDFYEKYPLGGESGYRIERKVQSLLDTNEGLIDLIKTGIKPESLGVELIKMVKSYVFTASLYQGDVLINQDSSLKFVADIKDWETGSTAALQRLVAACGFHGELIDDDELKDMKDNKVTQEMVNMMVSIDQRLHEITENNHNKVIPINESTNKPTDIVESPTVNSENNEKQSVKKQVVPIALKRQITQKCKTLGIVEQQYDNIEQANSILKELHKQVLEQAKKT